jgi:hypothetical protein
MEFLAFASFAVLVIAWIAAPSQGAEVISIEQKKAA